MDAREIKSDTSDSYLNHVKYLFEIMMFICTAFSVYVIWEWTRIESFAWEDHKSLVNLSAVCF